jgi:hypothetical protein
MPGPNWLTSWVKVNNRHVAYGGGGGSSSSSAPATQSPRASRQSPRGGGGRPSLGRNRGGGGGGGDAAGSKPAGSSSSGAASVPGEYGSRASARPAATTTTPSPASPSWSPPPSPKSGRTVRSGSASSATGGGGSGWKSSESSVASQSRREEPLFGVSTALRGDDLSVARSVPGTNTNSKTSWNGGSGGGGGDDAASLPLPLPRGRSGKKSASFDEHRAQTRESDLASAHSLLAGFFAAAPPFAVAASDDENNNNNVDDNNVDDNGSAATYPRFRPTTSRRVGAADRQPAFKSTGRYLNEAAFVQQLEQRQRADVRRPTPADDGRSTCGSVGASAASVPPTPTHPIPETSLSIRSSRHSRLHHSASSVKSDASPSAMSAPPAFGGGLKLFPPSFFPVDRPCDSCKTLQAKLEAALDDVEYLRTAVLEQEMASAAMTTTTAPAAPAASTSTTKSVGLNGVIPDAISAATATGMRPSHRPSVSDAARHVGDAAQRHRKQVEQLMKERVRLCLSGWVLLLPVSSCAREALTHVGIRCTDSVAARYSLQTS